MDRTIASTASRRSFVGILLLGFLLVVMGIPFVGMTVMTILLLSNSRTGGIPGALAVLVGVYLLTDFMGALISATGSGFLSVSLRTDRDLTSSIILSAGATSLVSILGMVVFPEMSLLAPRSVEAILEVYSAAGLTPGEVNTVFAVFLFVAPALMVLWAAVGTMVAGGVTGAVARRRGYDLRPGRGDIRIGLGPAWLLIASLAVNLLGRELPFTVRQAAVNASIVLALPYLVVGYQVSKAAFRAMPGFVLPVAIVAIFLPPLAIGVMVFVGILDTWMNFRLRISKLIERKARQ